MASEPLGSGPTETPRPIVSGLRLAADPTGFVPFDRFMDIALYTEGTGLYSRDRPTLGPRGDFYTAAHVHPLFGRTIGRRLAAVREALGRDRPFTIVELGPGDGTLAASAIPELGAIARSGGAVRYVLIDRSGPLRASALERARASGETAGVAVRAASALSAEGPFEGAVIASEVLDAQPTRRLRWSGDGWRELGVRVDGDLVVSAEGPLSRGLPSPPPAPPPEPGVVVEVSPAAEALVREVADHLARGLFLVLDYGMDEPELRAAHPAGTLAGVRDHRAVADPLESPGATDLSAFVNFTRVRAAAGSAGLVEVGYSRQAEALGRWGLGALLEAEIRAAPTPEQEVRTRLAAKNLLYGFERFRALELAAPSSAEAIGAISPAVRSDGR